MTSRRDENAEATRGALVAAARNLFGERGYSQVGLDAVARAAGVTTGAVYHHFKGKKDLFQAAAESVEADVLATSRGDETEMLSALRNGFWRAVLYCANPGVQRIIFVEAPQVIGPEAWREIELRYAFGAMYATLTALAKKGALKAQPADLACRTLLGLLREASAELVHDNSARTRKRVEAFVDRIFAAMFDD